MTENTPAVVNIVDVVPGAVKITGADLRDTDKVYDVYGRTYPLAKVKHGRNWTKFKRADLAYSESIGNDETMTVFRERA